MAGLVAENQVNIETVRRFLSLVFERGLTDLCGEFLHENVVVVDPTLPESMTRGIAGVQNAVKMVHACFDRYTLRLDDIFAIAPDIVVNRFTGFAVHKGGFIGSQAVGKNVTWTGNTIYKFRGALVEQVWIQWDLLGTMVQLELLPPLVPTNPPAWAVPAKPGTPFSVSDRRGNSPPVTPTPSARVEENVANMRYFFANLTTVPEDELIERCFNPNWRHDDTCMPPNCEFNVQGARQYLHLLNTCFEGFAADVQAVHASGDMVVMRLRLHGRHKGGFMNVPAGNQLVDYTGTVIIRCENTRMSQTWWSWDAFKLFTQLGMLPVVPTFT
jgi:predicted ester cyclase